MNDGLGRKRRLRNARKDRAAGKFQTTEQSMENYGNKRKASVAAMVAQLRRK